MAKRDPQKPEIDSEKVYSLKEFSELWEFYTPDELSKVEVQEPALAGYVDEDGAPLNLNPFTVGDPHDYEDRSDGTSIALSEIKSENPAKLFLSTIDALLDEIKNSNMSREDVRHLKAAFVRQFDFDYYVSPEDHEQLLGIARKHRLNIEEDLGVTQSDVVYSLKEFAKLFKKHAPDELYNIVVHEPEIANFCDEDGVPYSLNPFTMSEETVYETNPAAGLAVVNYMSSVNNLAQNPGNAGAIMNSMNAINLMASATQMQKRTYQPEGSNDPEDWDSLDVSGMAGDNPGDMFLKAIGPLLDQIEEVDGLTRDEKQELKEYFAGQFDLSGVDLYRKDYEVLCKVAEKHGISVEEAFGKTEGDIVKQQLTTEEFIERLVESQKSGKRLDFHDLDLTQVAIMKATKTAVNEHNVDLHHISFANADFSSAKLTELQIKELNAFCSVLSSGEINLQDVEIERSTGESLLAPFIEKAAARLVERSGSPGR